MKTADELNRVYLQADQCDKEIFAEMRSNVLLAAGDHYTKKDNGFLDRVRNSKEITKDQKLRLTKNHIHKIVKIYTNNILRHAPDTRVGPQLDTELQDIKAAEMHQAVWMDVKRKSRLKRRIKDYAKDYIEIGECAAKIFWDPTKGDLIGYGPTDDGFGNPVVDPMTGEMIPDMNAPIFSGQLVFERILPFNLLRCPSAKVMQESPYLIVRKMMDVKDLKSAYKDDVKTLEGIEKSEDETFLVFNGSKGTYEESKNQVLVREFYYRPCAEYPKGYFYFTTKEIILEQGELPGSIFPIQHTGFDEVQTTPRKRSIIKQLRPYQAEINRASSQAATHQITMGDDKLVVSNGAKVEQGGLLPGVRVFKTNAVGYNGGVSVIPGRVGDQFLPYINGQIEEMYSVANATEEARAADGAAQTDVYAMLYGSIRNKKAFSLYAEEFEEFLVDLTMTALRLLKVHLPEDVLIQMVGRKELVNISEFKNAQDLCWQIKVDPSSEDPETLIGKQLMINHTLQYVSEKLSRDDIGKILRESPFGNFEKVFDDFTVDYDTAKNDVLSLERGIVPDLGRYENAEYKVKTLTARMKQTDYKFLPPNVQMAFEQYLQFCERSVADKAAAVARAQSGFIPTDGYMVKADFYISKEDGKSQRATLPYAAVEWLIKKLEEQGATQASLEQIGNMGALADMANMNEGV